MRTTPIVRVRTLSTRSLLALELALVNSVVASPLLHFRLRTLLLRAFGVDINLRSRVQHGVTMTSNKLSIGYRSTLNVGVFIDNRETVRIGSRVGIGPGVKILTSSHESGDPRVRAGRTTLKPISIGDGVWIGAGAVILSGVTIGDGTIVAAGSVVHRDCLPNRLYGGVPAREIRTLAEVDPT